MPKKFLNEILKMINYKNSNVISISTLKKNIKLCFPKYNEILPTSLHKLDTWLPDNYPNNIFVLKFNPRIFIYDLNTIIDIKKKIYKIVIDNIENESIYYSDEYKDIKNDTNNETINNEEDNEKDLETISYDFKKSSKDDSESDFEIDDNDSDLEFKNVIMDIEKDYFNQKLEKNEKIEKKFLFLKKEKK